MSTTNGYTTTTSDVEDHLAFVSGGPQHIPSLSVWKILKAGLDANPDAIAIISTHQSADHASSLVGKTPSTEDSCLQWTFSELYHGASRVAAGLEAQGVERGTKILTLLPNCAEWSLMFWVAAMLQLTLVPLDSTLLTPGRKEQLHYFLNLLKPATIMVAGAEESRTFDEIAADSAKDVSLKLVAHSSSHLASTWKSLATITQDVEPVSYISQDEALDKDGERLATILFTSGTSTGRPKGCPVTASNCAHMMYGRADFFHMHPSSRILLHTVNFRAIHTVCSLAAWHNNGGVILAGENFNPRVTLDALQQHKATWCLCVPAHLQALASIPNAASTDTRTLEFMALAGDIVTEAIIEKSRELFPHTLTRNVLGMTEGTCCVGWTPSFTSASPSINSIPSVGQVLSGCKLKICTEINSLLPRDQIGQVHLGGHNMISGYYSNEQKESFYKDENGFPWVVTGDQGVIDKQGYFYILGRTKDVIMKNGIPLSPPVLEVFVQKELGVQSQVFSIPSPKPGVGQEPFMVVQTSNLSILESLPNVIAEGLGEDYRPIAVSSLSQLGYEEWPKNATGKIVKNELREKAEEFLKQQ